MAAITNLPPCPDNLKPMLHYIKAAIEHDNRDPVVAYWLRFHAVQLGIRIDGKSKPAKQFISGVMDTLETTKKTLKGNEAVTNDVVAQAHIENYALKLFNWADAEDRAGHFNKNVIKAFYSAGMLFDVLAVWGISEINEELAKQQKYAKWKAAYIHNCLKNGDTPIAGPQDMPGGGPDDEMFDASSGHNNNPVSGGGIPPSDSKNFPPASNSDSGNYPNTYSAPHIDAPARPPTSLPVAPPRGTTKAQIQTPSPIADRTGNSFITTANGVSLSSDDVAKALKYIKYAGSALQFDDVGTATDLLEKTLRLLKTGKEDS